VALRVLFEVESRAAFADRHLDRRLADARLGPEDRRLATQIVQGTLRFERRLDHVLDQLLHRPLAELPIWIRLCLRLGAFQLLFLDRVPRHAAVDETVALATKYGHPGTAGLVNAVLRRLPEAIADVVFPDLETDLVTALGVYESHPDWIVRRWLERYGRERTQRLLAANNEPALVSIRVNRRRTTAAELERSLGKEGIRAEPGRLNPDCLRLAPGAVIYDIPAFRDGHFTVQDESESLVVPLLNPRPGQRVLDLCAGPGGKLGHIAEWSRGEAHVIGVEIAPSRLERAREGLARLGARADLVLADGRSFGREGAFDRVLVDAPCSGLAVLRRRADARWRKTETIFKEMVPLQRELLDRAALLVAADGALVYSVCSFEPEECELQVAAFRERHPGWQVDLPGPGIPAPVVTREGFVRVLSDEFGTDGVFAVRLRRRFHPDGAAARESGAEDVGDQVPAGEESAAAREVRRRSARPGRGGTAKRKPDHRG
jgi:16S rRNA (cytosine967-C5)-methyltransferase